MKVENVEPTKENCTCCHPNWGECTCDLAKVESASHEFPNPHWDEGCIKCGGFEGEPCEPPRAFDKSSGETEPDHIPDIGKMATTIGNLWKVVAAHSSEAANDFQKLEKHIHSLEEENQILYSEIAHLKSNED